MLMRRNYDDPVYKDFRLRVLKRDKFKCKMPGCKNKKNLQVHHICKWSGASSLRYETSNGITSCPSDILNEQIRKRSLYLKFILLHKINS